MANIASLERFERFLAGILLLEAGYFWLWSPWSWVALAIGAILVVTALFKFCPLYALLGLKSVQPRPARALPTVLALTVLAAVAAGGTYASIFLTRKFYLEDFNAMNHFYKQTLFLTGKGERDAAISNLDQLKPALASFAAKYKSYRPHDLKRDDAFNADLERVAAIVGGMEPIIREGDLHEAHLGLEAVRPIFQDIFKRNGFSMLSVALVDFHDAMETILAAASAKDAAKTLELYPAVSEKLKAVEVEANDAEIQAIRKALDDLQATAQAGTTAAIPAKGDLLKSSFVKVYLTRG